MKVKLKLVLLSILLLITIGIITGCGGGSKEKGVAPILDTSRVLMPAAVLPDNIEPSFENGKTVYNFEIDAEMRFEVEEAKSKAALQ